jgi:glycosyltransferase involved in cell wall biosynthesis
MAAQTRQLCDLLRNEGIAAEIVQTNPPYRPAFVDRLRGVRAVIRLIPYVFRLWRAAGRSDVFHVMANSGWAWHLFAAPAIRIGKLRRLRVIVNYRGGDAERFFDRSLQHVRSTLQKADSIVVPSEFLRGVFARAGFATAIIPNAVDIIRFAPAHARAASGQPHIVIARHLERVYDVATAVRAFALLQRLFPQATLSIAGNGAERESLNDLVEDLGVGAAVRFRGELSRDAMADLYRSATLLVNSSIVDNTPNSLLEAMACGIPVVSTNVGGIPFLVQDGESALLVPPEDPMAIADAVRRLLNDSGLATRLVNNGMAIAQRCAWRNIYPLWLAQYGLDAPLMATSVPAVESKAP